MTHPTASRLPGVQWREGVLSDIDRLAPEETAVGLSYDGRPHAVLMATPADLEDLAVGFTVTEGIAPAAAIQAVTAEETPKGWLVDIRLSPRDRPRKLVRRRTLEGRSSCGLCGIQRLEDAVRPLSPVQGGARVTRAAIQASLLNLDPHQDLGRATRATHAAAWCDPTGAILAGREDVGRHNALDKVIGAAARQGLDPACAFLLVTSRCSYEMVEKTAAAGVGMIVAISAPTALAVRKAEEAGVTLVALARADGHTVFACPERILDELPA